jgi:hypothetical protein
MTVSSIQNVASTAFYHRNAVGNEAAGIQEADYKERCMSD